MGDFFSTLALLAQVLKLLPDLIQGLEKLFPEKGQGVVKLEILKNAVQETVKTVDGLKDPNSVFERLWALSTPIIAKVVEKYNTSGAFQKPA